MKIMISPEQQKQQGSYREGEPAWTGRRRERFFREADGWFLRTRGGRVKGPFQSRYEAQQELLMYLRQRRMGTGNSGRRSSSASGARTDR